MQSKILVTGTSGFSGHHLLNYLHNKGYCVVAHIGRTPIGVMPKGVECFHGDLAKQETVEILPKDVDVIVHCAAHSPTTSGVSDEIIDNIPATRNIIKYANRTDVKKIIYFSSVSLYGKIPYDTLYENSPIHEPDLYGLSKHMCEESLRLSRIPTMCLRLPGIVGKGSQRNWLSRVMQHAKTSKLLDVYNPDTPFNNVVHISYLCELVDKLIKENCFHFSTTLVASSGNLTVREVAANIMGDPQMLIEHQANKKGFTISVETLKTYLEPWTTAQSIDRYIQDEQ